MTDLAEAVTWLSASPAATALFTDFDGTLSAIVARPEDARPLPGAVAVLKQLGVVFGVVAVVSGRPASWLASQLELNEDDHVHAYGLHGLEHTTGGDIEIDPAVLAWKGRLEWAAQSAVRGGIEGVEVEDKGFGVTLHWRNADHPVLAETSAVELATTIAHATGLVARPGKASVELVPPIGVDKGTIVRRWAGSGSVSRVAFLGDDVSDLLAFDAIDELGSGLKIAVTGEEAPPRLLASADLVLPGPLDAVGLLEAVRRKTCPDPKKPQHPPTHIT